MTHQYTVLEQEIALWESLTEYSARNVYLCHSIYEKRLNAIKDAYQDVLDAMKKLKELRDDL
jgi:hypothetical protein